ncbi:hypothetical protein RHSIM_Rhsim01G0169800 [Rhododendron simsii]|uniref:Uncharacterized protein n=1 Tax=Rhododendron simsii TaxID=118357 RepID=A0A834HE26_RHOSS|nr:hypothetical protein RHSIM_Rhsim01G0169800 [Rhododendron simsii]
MDDMDNDDIMDEGVEFDISQNAELNDDLMPEINNEFEKKKVVSMEKRAPCWKYFTHIIPEGHPKPRAACNWGGTGYACHLKLNEWLKNAYWIGLIMHPQNNLLIRYLEIKTKDRKTTILNHEFLHVRCLAHILNLIVREGLQEIDVPIARVRNMVRYVRSSPSRMAEFWSCVEKEKIVCRLKPCLDVSTRWNYTYFMLERALTYQKAFDRLCDDPSFKLNVREEEMDEDFDDVDSCEGINRHNGSLNVRNKEVGGSSDTVDLDGLDTDIGDHKSLKSQFKIHKQKESNMASKMELEKVSCEN